MTVCIAAMAEHEEALVLVSDSKVSFGDFSSDRAVTKQIEFLPNWILMLAGNDIGPAGVIARRAQKECVGKKVLHDADAIAEIVHSQCRRERNRIVEAKILDKLGFTRDSFRAKGKSSCTDAVYYDLYSRIGKVALSLQFLLCGFDEKGIAHIRYTDADTPPLDYDPLGFYAIGSGANAALSSLCHSVEHLHLTRDSDLARAAYHALAAKFMSQSASDVGEETFLVSARKDQRRKFITPFWGMDYLKNKWEKLGAPRVPAGIEASIGDLLMTVDEFLTNEGIMQASKYSPRKLKRLREAKGLTLPSTARKSTGQQ